ncbi:hypothetical protein KVR01_008671 [Diaporthe batatas]|uniref:uncharacterized protein n=1 Tax=Diaporthe batatas TaxID=748121 RepID=UPI001D0510C4|nr:uncharacterized protein KVR01_008671 [Diaporthe batatas]KAG8161684.1 hypothetical protein KVR01_008671 [Diaporthe batatas]
MSVNNTSVASKRQREESRQPGAAKRSRLGSPVNNGKTCLVDDSHFSLKRIRMSSGMPIMKMLKKIQTTRDERGEASDFVRRLECLRLVHAGDNVEFRRKRINGFTDNCAIVSWSWEGSPEHEDETAGSYMVEDAQTRDLMRTSDVRDTVWRRAAAYMRYRRISHLWIDSECITQDPIQERQKAMSEMDRLYNQGSHPFGMLARPVTEEREVHLLAQILQGKLVRKYEYGDGRISIRKGMTEKVYEAIELLDRITSDRWWTRAWIYQENYHGGKRMFLLMPHTPNTERPKAKYATLFGNMKGEMVIKSIDFSEASTDLCSALRNSSQAEDHAEAVNRILSRAARYSRLLEGEDSMTPSIVEDVLQREVSVHPDRIDIIGNCCSYNVRLKRGELEQNKCSVSLAVLVLLLLNGEIFYYDPDEDTASSSRLTVSEFIHEYAFNRFSPPTLKYGLTFNKGCRFSKVYRIDDDGVHTQGHLWRLCSRGFTISGRISKGRGWVRKTLRDIQKYIREYEWVEAKDYIDELSAGDQLALRLEEFLKTSSQADDAETKYMWKMAEILADALRQGETLRLGYLEDSRRNPRFSPPTAIFVCADEIMEANKDRMFVFTSFEEAVTGNISDVDRHVSLQVGVNHTENLSRLYARRWTHGLWFSTEAPREVVFPLPRVLSQL